MIRPQVCPICNAELAPESGAESPHFPFCSERCQQVDLLRWSEGRYAIVDPLTPEQALEEAERLEGDPEDPRP